MRSRGIDRNLLGGMVGTLFSAVYPHKVRGLVLNDVGPEIDPEGLKRIGSYVGKAQPVITWAMRRSRWSDSLGRVPGLRGR